MLPGTGCHLRSNRHGALKMTSMLFMYASATQMPDLAQMDIVARLFRQPSMQQQAWITVTHVSLPILYTSLVFKGDPVLSVPCQTHIHCQHGITRSWQRSLDRSHMLIAQTHHCWWCRFAFNSNYSLAAMPDEDWLCDALLTPMTMAAATLHGEVPKHWPRSGSTTWS
jgi:hypothetical protein